MTRAHTLVKRTFVSKNFLLLRLTGGFGAAVNRGSQNLWIPHSAAIVVAYITGTITAFLLTKLFVFTRSTPPTRTLGVLLYASEPGGCRADVGDMRWARVLRVSADEVRVAREGSRAFGLRCVAGVHFLRGA